MYRPLVIWFEGIQDLELDLMIEEIYITQTSSKRDIDTASAVKFFKKILVGTPLHLAKVHGWNPSGVPSILIKNKKEKKRNRNAGVQNLHPMKMNFFLL